MNEFLIDLLIILFISNNWYQKYKFVYGWYSFLVPYDDVHITIQT